jgi:nucleotide-binding universal stress UspA family protein
MESHAAAAPAADSYGERPIRGALLGAVPYKLLHTSETPVVVVRV